MKYSFKLGQENSNIDLSKVLKLNSSELAEKLNSQIGAFDEIIDWGARYDGVFVAKIVKIQKHPGADKLNICWIDDGGAAKGIDRTPDGYIQVVCGAPNAKEGLTVAWVSPGTTVPSTVDDKEPFVLASMKIRGELSNGMLGSAKELGLGSNHDGILEITEADVDKALLKPGTPFKKLYNLDDVIVDFENKMFTHRPDCFGHLGVAREMAGIQGLKFESPEWYKELDPKYPKAESKLKLEVENQDQAATPRYMAVCLEGIKIAPSPLWLQSYLSRIGIKPINNIVDTTNYVMVVTSQPLHAFDYDKVVIKNEARIAVRLAKKDETLPLLSGKTIDLDPKDIVITDGQKPIALGGVMGGANSEIDDSTTRVILESANFDMYSIRRTSMRHGIFTDAVTRYTKGQSPAQTAPALIQAMQMIKELIPEVKFGEVVDKQKEKFDYDHLNVPIEKINNILGTNLKDAEIEDILNCVEIYSHEMGKLNEVCVTPPFWRQDLEIEEDVIEEIGRLYGFNKIDAKLPVRSVAPARKNPMMELKSAIRSELSKLGGSEVLTYNFVNENMLKRAGQDPEQAYKIRNALSPDLQRYRLSLLPNLLDKVHANIKAGEDKFALFELGKCHVKDHLEEEAEKGMEKDARLPIEFQRLSFIYASKEESAGAPFYIAKRYLSELLTFLGVKFKFVELDEAHFSPKVPISTVFDKERSAGVEIEGQMRAILGEFNPAVVKNFKLPASSAGFELDLGLLSEKFRLDPVYRPLNKFPSIIQDITKASQKNYAEALGELEAGISKQLKDSGIKFKVSPKSIYQEEGEKSRNFTFSIEFEDETKTLTTEEVSKILAKVE